MTADISCPLHLGRPTAQNCWSLLIVFILGISRTQFPFQLPEETQHPLKSLSTILLKTVSWNPYSIFFASQSWCSKFV